MGTIIPRPPEGEEDRGKGGGDALSPPLSGPLKVLVGMSGGVDSATAALLLKDQGHAVTGVMMSVRGEAGSESPVAPCGEREDAEAAARLARDIGVDFRVVDCAAAYRREVMDDFRREYLAGRTPNPCVRCNPAVKFGALVDLARAAGLDFDAFATGHYARIDYHGRHGGPVLLRGVDPSKDQSYFLYRLTRDQLAAAIFPLGGMRKTEVRRLAADRGLAVHDKPDSQDFGAGDYSGLLAAAPREGDIVLVDSPAAEDLGEGRVVGRHQGYWRFTPGQRRGLGVAYREPLYVLRVVPEKNLVLVGTREVSLRPGCVITDLAFNLASPETGARLSGRIRSSQPLKNMTVGDRTPDGGLAIRFAEPLQGVAPGQSLVLYDGDAVVGGGIIASAK